MRSRIVLAVAGAAVAVFAGLVLAAGAALAATPADVYGPPRVVPLGDDTSGCPTAQADRTGRHRPVCADSRPSETPAARPTPSTARKHVGSGVVTRIPSGAPDTGDGSTDEQPGRVSTALLATVLTVALVAAAAVSARARSRGRGK